MWSRLRMWLHFKLIGWPNVTGLVWMIAPFFAINSGDPSLVAKAGSIGIASAFWKLSLLSIVTRNDEDLDKSVDVEEQARRYAKEPTYQSEGAKELFNEQRRTNGDFWRVARRHKKQIGETKRQQATSALITGMLGALQLGYGDLIAVQFM